MAYKTLQIHKTGLMTYIHFFALCQLEHRNLHLGHIIQHLGVPPISLPVSGCVWGRRPSLTGRRSCQTQEPSPLQGSVILGGTMRTHGDSLIPSASACFIFAWFLRGDRFRSENAKDQSSLRNRKRSLLNYELCYPRKSKVSISSGLGCASSRGATLTASCPKTPTAPVSVAVQGG
jgi:hypothetical protein